MDFVLLCRRSSGQVVRKTNRLWRLRRTKAEPTKSVGNCQPSRSAIVLCKYGSNKDQLCFAKTVCGQNSWRSELGGRQAQETSPSTDNKKRHPVSDWKSNGAGFLSLREMAGTPQTSFALHDQKNLPLTDTHPLTLELTKADESSYIDMSLNQSLPPRVMNVLIVDFACPRRYPIDSRSS